MCVLFQEQAMQSHLLITQQQQLTKGVLMHLAVCCCINREGWKQDTTLYLCALATAGDRGKYNLNVQQ